MNTFEMKTAIHFGDNALDRLKRSRIKGSHYNRSICGTK